MATLLEVGRRLAATPPRNDVLLLLSDGEEDFLRGASLFSRHRWAAGVKGAVNFEARGVSGPSALFFQGSHDGDFLLPLGRAFNPAASSALVRLAQALPNDSDATVLQRSGIPSLAFAFADGLPHYHRASDSAANLSPDSLAHHLDHAAVFVSAFGDAVAVQAPSGPHVFFDVFGDCLVRYPTWLARVLSVVLAAGLLLLLRRGRLPHLASRLGRLVLALTGATALAVLATVAAVATGTWSRPLSFTVVLASLLVLCWLLPVRQGEGRDSGRTARAALWTLPAVLFGLFLPEVSYLFQWPALALLLAEAPRVPGRWRQGLSMLGAASAVVLWAWWAYTLLVAAGDAPAAGAMAACFGATAVAPGTGDGRQGRRLLAVAVGLGAAVTVWFTLSGRVGQGRDAEGLLRDEATRQVRRVRWDPQVDPWALRLRDTDFAEDGPPVAVPALDTESALSRGATRRLVLRARSPRGSSHLHLRELSGTPVRVVSVDGQPVGEIVRFSTGVDRWMWQHATGDRDRWRLQFAGLPPEGFRLELEVAAGAMPTFEVRDTTSEWTESSTGPLAASFASTVVRPQPDSAETE